VFLILSLLCLNKPKETFKDFCESRLFEKQKVNEKKEKISKIQHLLTGTAGNEIIKEAISKYFIDNGTIELGEENIIADVLTTTPLLISPNINSILNKGSFESKSRGITSQIEYMPSKETFCELLKKQVCYRHFILKNGRIETEEWRSRNGLDINTLERNVRSTPFYRKNKENIAKIILSPYPKV
ncbi:MAG: hypothetical protein K2H17_09725, partial [Duncaniella sp.]|uniref:hypothetical protein n=1 Tax=Duncaniella sp. TaxID=2518496 RepID=UPI0023CFBCA2